LVRLVGCVWNRFDWAMACRDGLSCLSLVDSGLSRNLVIACDAGVETVGCCTRQSEALEIQPTSRRLSLVEL
jgi:hypothetical protein